MLTSVSCARRSAIRIASRVSHRDREPVVCGRRGHARMDARALRGSRPRGLERRGGDDGCEQDASRCAASFATLDASVLLGGLHEQRRVGAKPRHPSRRFTGSGRTEPSRRRYGTGHGCPDRRQQRSRDVWSDVRIVSAAPRTRRSRWNSASARISARNCTPIPICASRSADIRIGAGRLLSLFSGRPISDR